MAALVAQSVFCQGGHHVDRLGSPTRWPGAHRNEAYATRCYHESATDFDQMGHEKTSEDHWCRDICCDLVYDHFIAAGGWFVKLLNRQYISIDLEKGHWKLLPIPCRLSRYHCSPRQYPGPKNEI